MVRLFACKGGKTLHSWLLSSGRRLIGSGPEADLTLDPSDCPEVLCVLEIEDGNLVLEDLGEGAIQRSNGAPPVERALLSNGDHVDLGELRFCRVDEPESTEMSSNDGLQGLVETQGVREIQGPAPAIALEFREGRRHQIVAPAAGMTFGRAVGQSLQLGHPFASNFHAKLVDTVHGLALVDRDSRHGTFLNVTKRLESGTPEPLVPGSIFWFTRQPGCPTVEVITHGQLLLAQAKHDPIRAIVGDSPPLRASLEAAERMSQGPGDLSILIGGETGVGKELMARFLRKLMRPRGPFVVVDCGSLTPTLAEALLFGSEKGAYTGADRSRKGFLRQAHGGVVFFDEIGELPLELQAKLLRALQEHRVTPVGADEPVESDFVSLFATHRNLGDMVKLGQFRADLYERLGRARIELPPLRERPMDIVPIAEHTLETRHGQRQLTLAADAEAELCAYGWPGNVRELMNVVDIAALRCLGHEIDGALVRQVLNLRAPQAPQAHPDSPQAVSERMAITETFRRLGGKWKGRYQAEYGRYSQTTLYRRLTDYGLLRRR
ncbi:MAG: sigma 54-interacting transcriptional regulator [Deltaproteobacteria bacterium]